MGSRTWSLPSRPALNSGAVAPGQVAASSGATSAAANPASATWRRRRQRNPVPPPGRGPGGSGAAQATNHAVQRRPVRRRCPGRVRALADQRALLQRAGPAVGAHGCRESHSGPAGHGRAVLRGLSGRIPHRPQHQRGLVVPLEAAQLAAVPAGGHPFGGGHREGSLQQQARVELAPLDLGALPPALPERTSQVGNAHVLGNVALAQVLVDVQELLRRSGRVAVGAVDRVPAAALVKAAHERGAGRIGEEQGLADHRGGRVQLRALLGRAGAVGRRLIGRGQRLVVVELHHHGRVALDQPGVGHSLVVSLPRVQLVRARQVEVLVGDRVGQLVREHDPRARTACPGAAACRARRSPARSRPAPSATARTGRCPLAAHPAPRAPWPAGRARPCRSRRRRCGATAPPPWRVTPRGPAPSAGSPGRGAARPATRRHARPPASVRHAAPRWSDPRPGRRCPEPRWTPPARTCSTNGRHPRWRRCRRSAPAPPRRPRPRAAASACAAATVAAAASAPAAVRTAEAARSAWAGPRVLAGPATRVVSRRAAPVPALSPQPPAAPGPSRPPASAPPEPLPPEPPAAGPLPAGPLVSGTVPPWSLGPDPLDPEPGVVDPAGAPAAAGSSALAISSSVRRRNARRARVRSSTATSSREETAPAGAARRRTLRASLIDSARARPSRYCRWSSALRSSASPPIARKPLRSSTVPS